MRIRLARQSEDKIYVGKLIKNLDTQLWTIMVLIQMIESRRIEIAHERDYNFTHIT